MMKYIIRFRCPYLRCPLLWVAFPLYSIPLIVHSLFSGRAFCFDFWNNNWGIFWAAHDGMFVGLPLNK